jgi:hypothetical protein
MASKAVLTAVPDPANPNSFSADSSHRMRRANGKLTLWQQSDLMRELALKDRTRSELAREYGVSAMYITSFARRYVREIAAMRANIEDEFAHLWAAKKVNRVLVLQKQVMDRFERPDRSAEDDRTIATMLKQISEELGQLPVRQNVVSARVVHVVEGFTSEEIESYLT